MDHAGMSMALGAFLMGMMLSTSRYSLQIEASLEPHKASADEPLLRRRRHVGGRRRARAAPFEFALHVLAIITIKVAVLYVLCLIFGTGRSTALRVAFLLRAGRRVRLSSLRRAKALGVIDDLVFVMAVAVISLTMLLTPLLVKLGNRLALRACRARCAGVIRARFRYSRTVTNPLRGW
jgi:glutathione-regulated potassium-efflux system ancillary protein KefC